MNTVPFVGVSEVMSLTDVTDRINEDFCRFSQTLQANVATVRKINPD